MREIKLFINNESVPSSSGKTEASTNPANGEQVAIAHIPTEKDLDRAVEAAEAAFYGAAWRACGPEQRAAFLEKIAEKLKERRDELVALEIADSGSTVRKAKADVANASSYFKVLAGQLRKFAFEVKDEAASRPGFSQNWKVYEPVGVCAQVIPWNFPLVMAAWKIGPVIASGCTTVLKSALDTPVTASVLAEIIRDVGVPAGVVNVVTGGAAEGAYLMKHPKVRKIAFTGSTEVGRQIMQNAGKDLKRLSLELGGKSANIVLDDADLAIAVDGALYAFLYHSGQACDSGTRLFVQEKIWPAFKEAFFKRAAEVKVGVPTDPASGLGPVVSRKQGERIMGYIEGAKKEGAKVLIGGERLKGGDFDKGWYIPPTVFEAGPDHTVWREEVFGPVGVVQVVKDEAEAIQLANRSIYGLAAAVWSKDAGRARKVAGQLEAGTVWINEYHLLNPGMPFGGYKQSGVGREMGEEGLKAYLEVKHLWISDCDERAKKPWFDAIF